MNKIFITIASICALSLMCAIEDVSARGSGGFGRSGGGASKSGTFKVPKSSAPVGVGKGTSYRTPSIRSHRLPSTGRAYRPNSYSLFKTPRYSSPNTARYYTHRPTRSFTVSPGSYRQIPSDKRAIDGDTFYAGGARYRIRGIDTPELGQPRAEMAKQRLQQLLNTGHVTVEPVAVDKYGRTVAVVKVNGQDVSQTLKAEGFSK